MDIDNAVAQDSPQGLAVLNDPDGFGDPIGWAVATGGGTDLAITSFTADPPVLMSGQVLDLSVSVANLGLSAASTFTVTIVEPVSGAVLVSRTLPGLAAGASVSGTVQFTVPAKDFSAAVAPGLYTLICSHDFSDTDPANDSMSVVVEIIAP